MRDGIFSWLQTITNPIDERPLPVRSRRAGLKRRVKRNVDYRTGRQEVTSHAGLELVREYLKRSGFPAMLRRAVGPGFPATDFGVVPMLLTLLALILIGGRRILHLRYEQADPLLARFVGLSILPSPRTLSAGCSRSSDRTSSASRSSTRSWSRTPCGGPAGAGSRLTSTVRWSAPGSR